MNVETALIYLTGGEMVERRPTPFFAKRQGKKNFGMNFHACLLRLRHTLHQRTLYSKEYFASQELNTLGSPTHLAKSQFTPQHTLVLNTFCHSEFFTPHYTLVLNTFCHSEPSTPHYTLLLNTLCLPAPFAS